MNPGDLTTYAAVYVEAGQLRRLWFQASSEENARALCLRWNAGYEGPAERPRDSNPVPEAYDEKAARRLLGGISRATLYRMLVRGELKRLPNTRRLLITRSSIEERCR